MAEGLNRVLLFGNLGADPELRMTNGGQAVLKMRLATTESYLDRNRVERAKIRLVVNRYSREVGLSKDAISTALHSDIFHVIPSDEDSVSRALVEGRPIPSSSAFGKSLIALADRLAGKNKDPARKRKNSWTGLFSSIFSRAAS